jgi:hypothetical protein
MDGFASRGRRPHHSIDIVLLLASFAMIAWIVVPH